MLRPADELPLQLMQIVDKLNSDYSQTHCTTLLWEQADAGRRAQYRSNRWTTRWDELPIVKS